MFLTKSGKRALISIPQALGPPFPGFSFMVLFDHPVRRIIREPVAFVFPELLKSLLIRNLLALKNIPQKVDLSLLDPIIDSVFACGKTFLERFDALPCDGLRKSREVS